MTFQAILRRLARIVSIKFEIEPEFLEDDTFFS